MRGAQIVFLTLLGGVVVVAGLLMLRSSQMVWSSAIAEVRSVPESSHEIAWIAPASNIETWQRIVEAAEYLRKQWSKEEGDKRLRIDLENAYLNLTAGVPEIVLWWSERPQEKIYLRWYKISNERSIETWIKKLSERGKPPLAILGGDSTRRAVEISETLKAYRQKWRAAAPLFLITTATADTVPHPGSKEEQPKPTDSNNIPLMDLYKNRSYRFSFTNTLMAEAVLDFVQEHPDLWPRRQFDPLVAGAIIPCAGPLMAATLLQADTYQFDYALYAVAWTDDDFSADLSKRFLNIFKRRYYPRVEETKLHLMAKEPAANLTLPRENELSRLGKDQLRPEIGDLYKPTPYDRLSAQNYLGDIEQSPWIRSLLVLPTSAHRARRFLRALHDLSTKLAPHAMRNIVVLSGDSISFNNVYRDRKVEWNVADLQIPLVFFCHRNPVDRDAGFREEGKGKHPWDSTSTWDLLFYRDMLEAVVLAAHDDAGLVEGADEFDVGMQQLRWCKERVVEQNKGTPFFRQRNRNAGTGEHVVWVQPDRLDSAHSRITVWSRKNAHGEPQRWRLIRSLDKVSYHDVGSSVTNLPDCSFIRVNP